jgi:transcriptional regulator with XRE-family HTH domain
MEFRQDKQILEELGARFKQVRLLHELGQEQLAEKAGLSRDMIRRFEKHGSTTLTNLTKLCRALGETAQIDTLFQLPRFSPKEAFENKDQKRQRVKHKRKRKIDQDPNGR